MMCKQLSPKLMDLEQRELYVLSTSCLQLRPGLEADVAPRLIFTLGMHWDLSCEITCMDDAWICLAYHIVP